jgi:REP element-mobilizing transposase RayT
MAWFADFEPARAASAALAAASAETDAEILAWVLMPDHAHLLLTLGTRWSLQRLVQRLKSASAREVNRAVGRRGALWARAFHDHALRTEEDLRLVARYIVLNPVRAGLVARCGDYPFWDAAWISHGLR